MAINDSGNIALNLSTQNLSEHERVEYIGQGVLAGRENNSETKLEVDSQKRSHPDSDSVDSDTFATLVVPPPPPRSAEKNPPIVVSPGTARPVVVKRDRNRSRSRSPKRRLLPVVPSRLARMLWHPILVICRGPLGALVALEAPKRSDHPLT